MKFIKESWKYIVGAIGFFVGLVWMMNANSSRKVKKIKKNIKSNETKTSEVDGKIKYIKKKIADTNRELKELKKKKPVVKNKNPRKATLAIKKRLKKK